MQRSSQHGDSGKSTSVVLASSVVLPPGVEGSGSTGSGGSSGSGGHGKRAADRGDGGVPGALQLVQRGFSSDDVGGGGDGTHPVKNRLGRHVDEACVQNVLGVIRAGTTMVHHGGYFRQPRRCCQVLELKQPTNFVPAAVKYQHDSARALNEHVIRESRSRRKLADVVVPDRF